MGISVMIGVMIDPRQHLVDRGVDHLAVGRSAHDRHVLADAVEHDHHVVERVAEDGQQRRHRGARHLPPGERVDRDRQPHVVDHREQRRQRELVLEPERQVEDDHREAEQDRVDRVPDDLLAEHRPDRVEAHELVVHQAVLLVEGGAQGLHLRRLERLGGDLEPVDRAAVDLLGGGLDLGALDVEALEHGAHAVLRGGALEAHLGSRAALEVEAQVEPVDPDVDRAEGQRDERDRHPQLPVPDPVELPLDLALPEAQVAVVAQEPRLGEHVEGRARGDHGGEQRQEHADEEREGEALDAGGGEQEEDRRGRQRDDVGVDDRGDALLVAGEDRGARRLAAARLLPHPFEDDHVGVGCDADREDDSCDAGQGQRDRHQHRDRVEQDRVDDQGPRRDDAEEAVVRDQEQHHQDEAGDAGDQALAQGLLAEGRRDLLLADDLQVDRQGAGVDLLGQRVGLAPAEVALDLGAVPPVDPLRVGLVVDRRVGDDLAVEDDREALGLPGQVAVHGELARDVGELLAPLARELDRHDRLAAAEARVRDRGAGVGDVAPEEARVVLEDVPDALRRAAAAARGEPPLLVGQEQALGHLAHCHARRDLVAREVLGQGLPASARGRTGSCRPCPSRRRSAGRPGACPSARCGWRARSRRSASGCPPG